MSTLAEATERRRNRGSSYGPGPRRQAVRTLHLVDADNLLGDPSTTDAAFIRTVFDAYRAAAGLAAGDHVVVATGRNGWHVLEVELAWPRALHRRRSGADGADQELLDLFDWAVAADRHGRIVVGSGDGMFAPAVERSIAAGLEVGVVARPEALSRSLASAARHVHLLLTEAAA